MIHLASKKFKWTVLGITKKEFMVKKGIIDSDLREVEKNLFKLITEDTGRFLLLLKEAQRQYLAECWSQTRQKTFAMLIQSLERNLSVMNSLLELSNFIMEGGWESTSANTLIMHQLIGISDYQIDWDEKNIEIQKIVFIKLQVFLCQHIEKYNNQCEIEKKKKWEEKQQLALLRQIIPRELNNVILDDNPESASQSQTENPEKTIFCLCLNEKLDWQLTWYDVKKRPNFLPIPNKMEELLNELPDKKIPLSGILHDKLKTCCDLIVGDEGDIYLFDDSNEAAEFAISYPDKYSICLKKNASKWQAVWYNLYGKPALLVSDEVTQALVKKKIDKLPLPNTLLYFQLKKYCTNAIDSLLAKKIQMQINAAELLNQEPIISSYVLTHLPSEKTLTWYDSMGNAIPINLAEYPILYTWLHSVEDWTDKLVKQLKTWLISITIRRDVSDAQKKVVMDVFQEKYGVALIVTDNFALIPPFKLREGVYLLTKEPAAPEGVWVLYLRQKNRINQLIDISGQEWRHFCSLLAKHHNLLPSELNSRPYMALKKSINDSIVNALKDLNRHERKSLPNIDLFNSVEGVAIPADLKSYSSVYQDEKVAKKLQEMYGIALLFADSFEQIPRFKRIPGTFLLTKESGEWVLHQRQKAGHSERIDTNDQQWQALHELLATCESFDLYSNGHSALKEAINNMVKSALKIKEPKKSDCVVEALDKQKFAHVIKHLGGVNKVSESSSSSCEAVKKDNQDSAEQKKQFQQDKANSARLFKPVIVIGSAPPPPPPMPF